MNRMIRAAVALACFACAMSVFVVSVQAQSVYGSIFGTVGGNLYADGMVSLFGRVNGVASGEGLQVREGAVVRGDT